MKYKEYGLFPAASYCILLNALVFASFGSFPPYHYNPIWAGLYNWDDEKNPFQGLFYGWRECMGIEPTADITCPLLDLKSRESTRTPPFPHSL